MGTSPACATVTNTGGGGGAAFWLRASEPHPELKIQGTRIIANKAVAVAAE
jgi:hypothetical protein